MADIIAPTSDQDRLAELLWRRAQGALAVQEDALPDGEDGDEMTPDNIQEGSQGEKKKNIFDRLGGKDFIKKQIKKHKWILISALIVDIVIGWFPILNLISNSIFGFILWMYFYLRKNEGVSLFDRFINMLIWEAVITSFNEFTIIGIVPANFLSTLRQCIMKTSFTKALINKEE